MTVFCNFRLGKKEERERKKHDHLYKLFFFFNLYNLERSWDLLSLLLPAAIQIFSLPWFLNWCFCRARGLVLPNLPSCQYQALKLTSYKLTFLTLYRSEKQKTTSCSWKIWQSCKICSCSISRCFVFFL